MSSELPPTITDSVYISSAYPTQNVSIQQDPEKLLGPISTSVKTIQLKVDRPQQNSDAEDENEDADTGTDTYPSTLAPFGDASNPLPSVQDASVSKHSENNEHHENRTNKYKDDKTNKENTDDTRNKDKNWGRDEEKKKQASFPSKNDDSQSEILSFNSISDVEILKREFSNLVPKISPQTRFILRFSPDVENKTYITPSGIPLEEKIGNGSLVSILQRTKDVDFALHLPLPFKKFSVLSCRVLYDPLRDDCIIRDGSMDMKLIDLESSEQIDLVSSDEQSLHPGLWRITVSNPQEQSSEPWAVCDFLLLRRNFALVLEHKAKNRKRTIEDEQGTISKRLKLDGEGTTEIIVSPFHAVSTSAMALTSSRVMNTLDSLTSELKNKLLLTSLEVGDRASMKLIRSKDGQLESSNHAYEYQLSRLETVGGTPSASVFACQHSEIPRDDIVAKVLQYSGDPKMLRQLCNTWKKEVNILRMLQHPHIMSLKGYDARLFAIYLEHLPGHLRPSIVQYTKSDHRFILGDCASGLQYLESKNVIHNDIKPVNITYSRERGAVLIDFGLATRKDVVVNGGSPHYIPLEFSQFGKRGAPGDIWALGITMLELMGFISLHPLPEKLRQHWSIARARSIQSPEFQMMRKWLDWVSHCRNKLDRNDTMQSIVYDMLDSNYQSRVTAYGIIERLGK